LTKTKTKLDWEVSYKTIGNVLYSLKKLDEGEEIEAEQKIELEKACRDFLIEGGYKGEINFEDEGKRREIMAFLIGLNEEETEENSTEQEMGSRSLNATELEKLVADYEKALVEGRDRDKVAAEFEKKSGENVRNFVTRQQEIYWESLKRSTAEGIEKKKAEVMAEKMAKEEEKRVERLKRTGVEEEKARKVVMEARRVAEEKMAKGANVAEIEKAVKKVVKEETTVKATIEEVARVETATVAHRLAQKIGGKEEVSKTEELVVAVLRGQREEIKEGEVEGVSGVELKEANQAIVKTKKEKEEILEIEEKRVLREAIVEVVAEAPGNEEVAREKIEKYAGMVAELSVSGAIEAYREEAREETEKTGVSPGQFEEGFARTKVVYRLMVTGNFRREMEIEEETRGEIPNLTVADNFRQVRAVEGVMREMRAPDVVNSFVRARRRIAGAREWMGAFKGGGMDGVVLNLKNKIGSQPLVTFAKETSMLMSQGKSLGQALGAVFKGLATSGKVAAGAGVKAGAGVAAKGLVGALGGPIGWVIALAPLVKKVFGKIGKVMENLGLSLGIKKWMRENIGNIPGGLIGAGTALGGVALALGGAVGAAFTAAIAVIPIVIIGLFAFLVGYPLLLQSGQISSLVAPVNLGAGINASYDDTAEPLLSEFVPGTCNDVRKNIISGIKQNSGEWADKSLPKGCTFSDSGCGPTAVAQILMKQDMSLTPEKLVYEDGSAYEGMGCEGSSLEQAKETLEKHSKGEFKYDLNTRSCSKRDIATWICEGKIVMVLANFYLNKELKIGGHYTLAVEVRDGEVYSSDPFFNDGAVFDGQAKSGHVQAIRDCLVIDVDKK